MRDHRDYLKFLFVGMCDLILLGIASKLNVFKCSYWNEMAAALQNIESVIVQQEVKQINVLVLILNVNA